MFDISNFQPPTFIPPLTYAQLASDVDLVGMGFKPLELIQIQSFIDYFDFKDCIMWFNEPLIPHIIYNTTLSASEWRVIRHSSFMKPDVIIYRPPSSIFLIEFTRQLTTRSLGQMIHYHHLYRLHYSGMYHIHNICVFSKMENSIIQHLHTKDYLPILEVELELEAAFTPEYCICNLKNTVADPSFIDPNWFMNYDNCFQHPNIMPDPVV